MLLSLNQPYYICKACAIQISNTLSSRCYPGPLALWHFLQKPISCLSNPQRRITAEEGSIGICLASLKVNGVIKILGKQLSSEWNTAPLAGVNQSTAFLTGSLRTHRPCLCRQESLTTRTTKWSKGAVCLPPPWHSCSCSCLWFWRAGPLPQRCGWENKSNAPRSISSARKSRLLPPAEDLHQ